MKKTWIDIKKMAVPGNTEGYILMYSPGPSQDMEYMKIPYSGWKKITDATHWQPCLPPDGEE